MGKDITISLKSLEKNLGQFHLGPVDLDIQDSLVILGPTGSGKTTLFEIIAGFIKPDKGKIFFENEDITEKKPEQRSIGLVYQDYQLFPHLDVYNNIAFGLKLRKLSQTDIEEKIQEIAETFNIKHLLKSNVRSLSGGEKQKVALARSLVIEPKILLMDEPFSAIDEEGRGKLIEEFKSFRRNLSSLIILVTHNQEEAYELAEKVAIIYEGKIMAYGNKVEVFSKPQKLKIARFLGFKNIFSSQELLSIGIQPPTNNEFFALPNDKIHLGSKRSLMLKGKIEMYESLRNKIRMIINANGIKFEKEVNKDFSFTPSEINLGIDPTELIPLE
jgi:ABC-type sugar transport system ATPase subunit